ncbi:MAG: MFS transporter [Candidatus Curtissbacteria bacterium]|nr:MFS transporter [Candidatus Curtissbacteria bacterium]
MGKEEQEVENIELASLTGSAPVKFPAGVISVFPALVHRNFQFYVFGQVISLVGFWIHQVALAWLVFELTKSAFWVGTVAAIGSLPFLFFTTFAGVFIDKVNKQKLLIWTQTAEAIIAITLGILALNNAATLKPIIILIFLHGIVGSFDLPARLTFIIEMVGKRDLASAIPINNGLFNAARFIGPGIAGLIIATHGVGWPFIINGVSYIAGIWAILNIKPVYKNQADVNTHPYESLKQGIKFSLSHTKILYFTLLGFFSAVFIWPFQTLMPLVAQNVYASGATGFGSLLSAAGAGSLTGAFFTSAKSQNTNKIIFVTRGFLVSSIALILFSFNRNFLFAHILLFLVGFGLLMSVSTLNTLVQLNSPDKMRARVMAFYLTMFIGMMPLGSLLSGIIAEKTSAITTIGYGGAAMLIVYAIFYLKGIFTKLSK